MLRSWTCSILLAAALVFPTAAEAAIKIAVVDVQRVMESTDHWKEMVKKLENERTQRQAVLEKKQKELRQRKEQIDAQKAVVDPTSLVKKEEELYRDAQGLTQAFMENQQALTQLEQRATELMLARVEAVVREVAVEGDYAFVFETGPENARNVWYAKPKIDITKSVITKYGVAYKGKPLEMGSAPQ